MNVPAKAPYPAPAPATANATLTPAAVIDCSWLRLLRALTVKTASETDAVHRAAAYYTALELLESRTLDGRTQELIYRPALHA